MGIRELSRYFINLLAYILEIGSSVQGERILNPGFTFAFIESSPADHFASLICNFIMNCEIYFHISFCTLLVPVKVCYSGLLMPPRKRGLLFTSATILYYSVCTLQEKRFDIINYLVYICGVWCSLVPGVVQSAF